MQTFVPSPIITETVECLDYRRLGKQRVEALQIIKALTVPDYGWKNHPATKMWADHVPALKWYHNHCVREWVSRGYNNTMELYPSEELEGLCQTGGETTEFTRPTVQHSCTKTTLSIPNTTGQKPLPLTTTGQ